MEKFSFKNKEDLNSILKNDFSEALKDPVFNHLCEKLNVKADILMKYTTKLKDTTDDLKRCKNCKGLFECKNAFNGFVTYPKVTDDKLVFSYLECAYKKNLDNALSDKDTFNKELKNARMKDIDVTDLNRKEVIKWIKKFYDEYDVTKKMKGLYLNGNFGCGKTFLIAALFNELELKKNARTEIVYFPEFLRTLKDDFTLLNSKINYYQNVDLLLIDDLGAEKVSEWGRDEVLGTILQSRMNNNLTTFFTSNLSIKDLESHLAIVKNNEDTVKARRIIERIKQLTVNMEMLSANRRK